LLAVSISSGMARGRASWSAAFAMAATFGVFQAAA
jgi:putative Mn2+ efflux pump MntP